MRFDGIVREEKMFLEGRVDNLLRMKDRIGKEGGQLGNQETRQLSEGKDDGGQTSDELINIISPTGWVSTGGVTTWEERR